MTLKLNGSSSGYTAIDAPAAAGSNTLVLPADNGSNGEFLKTNGSGTLDWAAVSDTNDFVLLKSVTSSNAATTIIDGYFSSTYRTYYIVGTGLTPTADDKFNIRFQTGGSTDGSGSAGSALSTGVYAFSGWRSYCDTSNNNQISASSVHHSDFDGPADIIQPQADNQLDDATHESVYRCWLYNPLSTTAWKWFDSDHLFTAQYNVNRHVQQGVVKTTDAITGIRVYYTSNNHDCVLKLYGLK